MLNTTPGPSHDDECEAEFLTDTYAWTPCGCGKRADTIASRASGSSAPVQGGGAADE